MIDFPEQPRHTRPTRLSLREAIRMSKLTPRRPTLDDAPPLSTFPMTPAARAAIHYSRRLGSTAS